jgi:sialate O-acetylesterase
MRTRAWRPAVTFTALAALFAIASRSAADVKLPSVLGSHMVLQRELPLPVWGTGDPGEQVSVRLDDGGPVSTTTDAVGRWRVNVGPFKADGGKPHRLAVSGKNIIMLDDLLIGEVWLASGQSNMAKSPDAAGLKDAQQPQIRLFQVPAVQARAPAKDVDARWAACTPDSAAGFSAVAYFFGRKLHEQLKVPVGLINASRGSTAIEQFFAPSKPGDRGGAMYNGSIAPLIPISIRGVIWYQGEANRADGLAYAAKQQALIEGWRKLWSRDFSFDLVQIAPFTGYGDKYDIPSLWEAQLSGLKLPHVGVAVINDTAGNMANIHPGNKDKVGERLALWALATLLREVDITTRSRFEKMDIDQYAGDAGRIAAMVRASWGLPMGPVNSLIGAIESAGGIVFSFSFGTKDIDALSQWPDGMPPLFFVNSDVPADRWRFSLAHELGHIIMHEAATEDMEGEANRFASEFLMPANEITSHLRNMRLEHAANLKPVWRVSMAALLKRSYDLKQTTESQYRRLFTLLSASGYRKQEPVDIRPEFPTMIPQIVSAYQQSAECSVAEISRAVHLVEQDFREKFIPELPVMRIAR